MNFARKSTDGFNIGNVLLDFFGGVANYAQMAVQSIDQGYFFPNYRFSLPLNLSTCIIYHQLAAFDQVLGWTFVGTWEKCCYAWYRIYTFFFYVLYYYYYYLKIFEGIMCLLLQVSIIFDIIFICQRFVLYPRKEPQVSPKSIEESGEPLVISFDDREPEWICCMHKFCPSHC